MKESTQHVCWHRPSGSFFTELGPLPTPREVLSGTIDEARVWEDPDEADLFCNNFLAAEPGWMVQTIRAVTSRSRS